MSSALAIASVTAVLRDLLNDGLINKDITSVVGNVIVSALPPDRIDVSSNDQQSQLNLFLYQVTPNAAWRNVGLPSRNSNGDRISNPPLALNLHYLLTAYGAQDLHAEILLGYGMQLFHETPVLPRKAINQALQNPSQVGSGSGLPSEMRALLTSELAEQVEQIKIVPETLNTEEISRMWSAFQAHYRPTAAYQASVVLIESKQSTKTALPVKERQVHVIPFNQPVIDEIRSQAQTGDPIEINKPILPGHNLVLVGHRLSSDHVLLDIGGVEVTPAASDIGPEQIIVPVPATLKPGVQGVQVVHSKEMGNPPALHRVFESNLAAFVLRPVIDPANVQFTAGPGDDPIDGIVSFIVEPPVGDAQRVMLILNEIAPVASPPVASSGASYSFLAPSRTNVSPPLNPPDSTQIFDIPIKGVKAGTYLVRVQIDGAESPLTAHAVTGQYIEPQVVIA
jgi:hypothetical protein